MLTFLACLIVSTIAGSFYDASWFEMSVLTFALLAAVNTMEILKYLKKEQLTDEESLRAMRERDQLLAALKAMQETNPGTLEFTPRSGAQIKQARAAWVQASAVIAEVEKNNGY